MISPRPFGSITAGADKSCPLDKEVARLRKFGSKADEIFVSYEELRAKFGKDVEKLPLGAVGIYTATQKIRTGLQQLMAGSRNFILSISGRRFHLAVGNRL